MARDNSDNVVWFLTGAAVGAAIALLYAPQTGRETRRQMARGARRMKREARDFAATARDAASTTREALERRLARHHDAQGAGAHDGEDDGV